MTTNQNSNNFRRPPLRPNPNAPRNRQQGITPRPRPSVRQNNNNNNQQQGPTAQDMFASLTQAYNNMVNNLQFMNAVGIVNGIYQNASNMHNANFQNPYFQQQMANMQNAMGNQQPNDSNQNVFNDEKEKKAFFDE